MIWQAKYIVLLAIIRITSETKPSIRANYAPKIINGDPTTIEKWPFLVQVVYKNLFTCGACAITDRWVLTAGHCFQDTKPAHFKIYADSSIPRSGTGYDVETIKLHEHYEMRADSIVADVALMQLKGRFRFSNTLQPIKLNFVDRQSDTDYKNCSTAGWGLRDVPTIAQVIDDLNLQELDVETVPHEDCKLLFPVLRSNLCTRGANRIASPCYGDSGGPLVCGGVLVGVVSFGDNNCSGLTIFAKVASFYTWMKAYIKKFDKKFGISWE